MKQKAKPKRYCRCKHPKVMTEDGVRYCFDCGHEFERKRATKWDVLVALIAERVAERVAKNLHGRLAEPAEPWIGVAEAARHLACKPKRIYDLTSAKTIPFAKDGSRLLFRRSDLNAWLKRTG